MDDTLIEAAPAGEARRLDRRLAILDAAESLFIEFGLQRASLAAIVKRSGGSLATVYELFGSKQGLLRAVIEEKRVGKLDELEALTDAEDSPAQALRRFAYQLHDFFTQPRSVALMRIMIEESLRDPQFAHDLHRDLHIARVRELAEIFRNWTAQGKADFDDPDAGAELYFATVKCDAQINAMVGIEQSSDETDKAMIDWRLAPFIDYFQIK